MMEQYRITKEDGTVERLMCFDTIAERGATLDPETKAVLCNVYTSAEMLRIIASYVQEGCALYRGWGFISPVQMCDDCDHPHGWHYTCYSGGLQGCSYEGCKCTGFFAYIEDPKEVAE